MFLKSKPAMLANDNSYMHGPITRGHIPQSGSPFNPMKASFRQLDSFFIVEH